MTYAQFMQHAKRKARENPSWRRGQTLMNTLYVFRHDLYDGLHNSDIDPFYDDSRFYAAIAWLEESW